MQGRPGPLDWMLLASLCLAWGLAFMLIAIGLESFPPITLVASRLAVGALVLYVLMRWQGFSLPREWIWWRHFACLTLLGNLVPFTLISWGQQRIASSQAGLLMALVPISTMLLAHFFVPLERLTAYRVIGVLAGFAGVVALVGPDALAGLGSSRLTAQLAIIGATFAYAINNVYAKRLPPLNGLVKAAGSLIAGALLILPVCLVVEQPWRLEPAAAPVLAVIALGVFATGLATWVFFLAVTRRGPNFISLINYVVPVVAFVAGVTLLHEDVTRWQLLGLVTIFAGIAISQRR